jgi:hypothetical protein
VDQVSKMKSNIDDLNLFNPNDTYPLKQLAQIFDIELKDTTKVKYYQAKANKIGSSKFM